MPLKRFRSGRTRRLLAAVALMPLLTSFLAAPSAAHAAPATGALGVRTSGRLAVTDPTGALAVRTSGRLAVTDLRTNALADPIGVDTAAPTLSWTITSDGYGQRQTRYRIQAAGTPAALAAGDHLLWDSGTVVSSNSIDVAYHGATLVSRQRVYWRVKVDNGDEASPWSEPAFWEMGLLSPGDWQARWIKRSPSPTATLTNAFAPRAARYVRLRVYETGPVAKPDPVYRLQIMELRVRDGDGHNLAAGATVTGRDPFTYGTQWGPARLVDGDTGTGFSTVAYPSAQHGVDDPLWVQVDLGQSTAGISSVQLVNRTDQASADRTTPNYPKRYQVQTSEDGQQWSTAGYYLAGTGAPGYDKLGTPQALDVPTFTGDGGAPAFASRFEVDPKRTVARARLYISGLGLYYAEVNGRPVADSYFDPSESDYRRRIFYSSYDVTGLVTPGGNGVGFMLGNGMYGNGVSPNGGRYEKTDGLPYAAKGLHGTAKGVAQLEVTYTDGTRTTVASGDSWKYTDSAITFDTWYGGEDYDAGRAEKLAGWSTDRNDFTGWAPAQRVPDQELPTGTLHTRPTPPMRIVQTLQGSAVSHGQFPDGAGWVDVSRNGAGFEGIRFAAAPPATPGYAGVSLQFHPAEIKTDTDVDQSSSKAGSAPVFDTYTFSGHEKPGTTWNPRFVYHGFRYYKLVLTLPAGRTPADYGFADKAAMLRDLMTGTLSFVGHIVRTDNATTGSFTSSNASLNLIHTIIDRSIASQMYSEFTDCPHIEKLGWMETSHLMLPSITGTYDARAWLGKISQDAIDSQVTAAGDPLGEPGYATAIAPPFQIINGLNTDPNWNGAIILTPWEHYQAYGDPSVLRNGYPAMQKYLQWLQARYAANGYLVDDAQMGDWGQYQVSTPTPLVVTAAFYRMADAMARTATILGHPRDATAYTELAAAIRTRVNAAYYNPATGVYGTGTQASYAVALFSSLVPAADVDRVVGRLVQVTEDLHYTVTTGEIALRQLISTLIAHGRSDVVYRMALQPDQPGYRYIAETLGETTMIEYWNYRDQWGGMRSRNHAMMGHLQDWFARGLAGIDTAGPGYRDLVIKPYVPDNAALPADSRTTSAGATVGTSYGTVGSSWRLGAGDRSLSLSVRIPVGTTATVYVPALGYSHDSVSVSYGSVRNQSVSGTLAGGYVKIEGVPSGNYTFQRLAPRAGFAVTSVQPASVPGGGLRTITVHGTSLDARDTVEVTPHGGAARLAAVRSAAAGGTSLTVQVDLTSAASGRAGVTVRPYGADVAPAVLPDAFAVTAPKLKPAGTPVITGTVAVGRDVTATTGRWTPAATSYAYQWAVDGAAVKGATGARYRIPAKVLGRRLTVAVTARRAGYVSATAVSARTAPVAKGTALRAVVKPWITGRAKPGSTVRAVNGVWSPTADRHLYQWRLNGSVIRGATRSTLKPTRFMVGKRLTVTVVAITAGYANGKATSAPVPVRR